MTVWYCEERSITGKWVPAFYYGDPPAEKRLGGGRRKLRFKPINLSEMPALLDKPLAEVQNLVREVRGLRREHDSQDSR